MTIQSSVYRWYRQGTVAVTNGSTAVTGTTTAWSTNVKAGDGFSLDGATWYEVASVTDNTHIVLASNFGGSTTSGAAYAIDRRSLAWQVGSEAAARVLALQQMLQQTLRTTGRPPDTIGSDGAVAYDATDMVFYTNTGGAWDTGTSFRGSTVLNGSGAPSSGTGNNADFYLDTTNTRLYGPKTGGAWGSYVSLVGPTGSTGATGATGATGPANTLSIGTVTTGAAGSSASATITGTAPTQTLSLTIPRGDTGASGSGSGNVTGPASSVVGNLALFNDTSGTLLKDGGALSAAQQALVRANIITAPVEASAALGLCVNPFFEVSQENGTTLQSDVGSSGKYAADQWLSAESAATLVMSAQQVATPFSSTSGFKRLPYSVKAIATTAQASLGSSEVCTPCRQTIEGTFWQTLGWGTSDGVDAVVVGVIMPSVTGTYPVTIRNAAGTRSMVKTVSLTANTPAVIYETFSADTSGTWVTSTSASAIIEFGTTSGSTYETSTLGSWQSADYRSATTATDWQGTTNAFVQVAYLNVFPAGVLPWSSASEITGEALQRLLNMRRPFDDELRRCQRYFEKAYFPALYSYGVVSQVLYVPKTFAEKALSPAVSVGASTNRVYDHTGSLATPTTWEAGTATSKGFHLVMALSTGMTGHDAFTADINGRL